MTTGEQPHVALLAVSILCFVHVDVWCLQLQVPSMETFTLKYCGEEEKKKGNEEGVIQRGRSFPLQLVRACAVTKVLHSNVAFRCTLVLWFVQVSSGDIVRLKVAPQPPA